MMRRVLGAVLGIAFLLEPAAAEYQVKSSTVAVPGRTATPRRRTLPKYPIGRNIRKVIKATHPNPRVQAPASNPLPAVAPEMPPMPKPQDAPPASRADRFFNAAAKVMTKSWKGNVFVWLPAISTDPNTGPTVGLMPVMVLADPQSKHIRHLIAPSYTYNALFGQTVTSRYYYYPTDESQLYNALSYSQHENREVKIRYENTAANDGTLYLRGEAFYNADASLRFFGIGQSHEADETGFTGKNGTVRGSAGINFGKAWRATIGGRFQSFTTDTDVIENTIDLRQRFPTVPGVGTNKTITSEFRLLYDTRDSGVTPSMGSSGELFVEKTTQALGSDSDYFRYGLEGKRLFPWTGKHITAVRAVYEKVNGSFIPFYELPAVGGRNTLRAYGDGRFVDRGRLVANIEHRIIFSQLSLMGIQTNFEASPFFDLGTVFPNISEIQRKNLRPAYGAAFRAAVKPNVVGDVEVGIGKEGTAVFVDINYPF